MKKIVIIMFIGAFLFHVVNIKLLPLFASDDSCIFFPNPEGCQPDGDSVLSNDGLGKVKYLPLITIGGLVSEGGTYFYSAKANLDYFISKVENSEITPPNYEDMDNYLSAVLEGLKITIDKYTLLCEVADRTPYNENISYLKSFDFSGFRENNSLTADVFLKVESYLKAGNVKEVYHYTLNECSALYEMVEKIKASIELKRFDINLIWKTNQKFIELALFGQLNSMVFRSIRENIGI